MKAFDRRVARLRSHVQGHAKLNEKEDIKTEIGNLTVKELKEVAKEKNIEGYSNMKREELLEILTELEDGE